MDLIAVKAEIRNSDLGVQQPVRDSVSLNRVSTLFEGLEPIEPVLFPSYHDIATSVKTFGIVRHLKQEDMDWTPGFVRFIYYEELGEIWFELISLEEKRISATLKFSIARYAR